MYTISKVFLFSASHVLNNLPGTHPCSRLHGHNYKVTVYLQSTKLNETGFVVDYRELEPIKQFIDNTFDHRHLNDVFASEILIPSEFTNTNPSAENIAKLIFKKFCKQFPQLIAVEVSETDKTVARYDPIYDTDCN